MADTYKQRLDGFLRDQRHLVQKVGQLERTAAATRRKPEDEFWGEEAGRRFVAQQEELVALKEENTALKELIESGAECVLCVWGGGGGGRAGGGRVGGCRGRLLRGGMEYMSV